MHFPSQRRIKFSCLIAKTGLGLPLRNIVVAVVVIVAVIAVILSVSYPSIVVSNISTQPIPNFATYTTQYATGYPQMP